MAEWSKATDLSSVILRNAQVRTLLDAFAPLAQLVMRRTYNAEIVGSSPTWSIASLAQSAEHLTFNQRVVGSSPTRGYSPRQDLKLSNSLV